MESDHHPDAPDADFADSDKSPLQFATATTGCRSPDEALCDTFKDLSLNNHMCNQVWNQLMEETSRNPLEIWGRQPQQHVIFKWELILYNILSRLPVKCLLKCRSVSWQWFRIISSPTFVKWQLSRAPATVLIKSSTMSQPGSALYLYDGPQDRKPEPLNLIDVIIRFPGSSMTGLRHMQVLGSPKGVVCIVQHSDCRIFHLWNPSTGSYLCLPPPKITFNPEKHRQVHVGMHCLGDEYIIVRIISLPRGLNDTVEILSIKDGQWKTQNTSHMLLTQISSTTINGIPYWRAIDITRQMENSGQFLEIFYWFDGKKFRSGDFASDIQNIDFLIGEVKGELGALTFDQNHVYHIWSYKQKMNKEGTRTISKWSQISAFQGPASGTFGIVFGFLGEKNLLLEVQVEELEVEVMKKEEVENLEQVKKHTVVWVVDLEEEKEKEKKKNWMVLSEEEKKKTMRRHDYFFIEKCVAESLRAVTCKAALTEMPAFKV